MRNTSLSVRGLDAAIEAAILIEGDQPFRFALHVVDCGFMVKDAGLQFPGVVKYDFVVTLAGDLFSVIVFF
jgi:hypothetical protein